MIIEPYINSERTLTTIECALYASHLTIEGCINEYCLKDETIVSFSANDNEVK